MKPSVSGAYGNGQRPGGDSMAEATTIPLKSSLRDIMAKGWLVAPSANAEAAEGTRAKRQAKRTPKRTPNSPEK